MPKQELECFHNAALVILKPDAIDFCLENNFIRDLDEIGLVTKYRQLMKLQPQDIVHIYPELQANKLIFQITTNYMTASQSMLLLVQSTFNYEGSDLHMYLKQNKGRANENGLRRKYMCRFEDELSVLYPDNGEFLSELCKNRIHSPEDAKEASELLLYLWPLLEREKIKTMLPDVYYGITNKMRLALRYGY